MKLITFIIILFSLISSNGWGQQNLLPVHSFYKDQLFSNKLTNPVNNGSFLPVSESDYPLIDAINDSSKHYYTFTHILFQKHLIEIKGKDTYITISPAANLSISQELIDTNSNRLLQNTRGVFVEGDLFKSFSFSTSFYENQAEFSSYETNYYTSIGEQYPQPDSTYLIQNGVIPGAGRTKPFKTNGFDYAYAVGYFVYSPIKKVKIIAGNNLQFIGDGHRSLFLSDNSYGSPYFRIDWKISPQWNFTYYRTRHLNLLRKPASSSVEAFYEPKGFGVNYLTYSPNEKIQISLFEGSVWNNGNATISKRSHPLFYNPVPFINQLALNKKNEVVSLLGLNFGYQIHSNHRLYSQIGVNDLQSKKMMLQLGYRGYRFFGIPDLMTQVEYNYVAEGAYETENRRLNYSHYNLPLAHVKGNGFHEFIFRANYEIKRFYLDQKFILYRSENYSPSSHLVNPDPVASIPLDETTIYQELEFGYRFNRKMNLSLFLSGRYRTSTRSTSTHSNGILSFGLRTGLTNHYNDF